MNISLSLQIVSAAVFRTGRGKTLSHKIYRDIQENIYIRFRNLVKFKLKVQYPVSELLPLLLILNL